MLKKILFLIVLFHFTSITSFALSEIIPPKKPIQTKEETQKKLLIDVLKPLPKPIDKTEIKNVEKKVVVEKEKKNTAYFAKEKTFNCWIKKSKGYQNI